MTSDNAVPLTPEFVEREMVKWITLHGFGGELPQLYHTVEERPALAKSFVTVLFNNARAGEEAKTNAEINKRAFDVTQKAKANLPDPGDAIDATTKIVGGTEWTRCPCLCHKDHSILHYQCPQRCTEGWLMRNELAEDAKADHDPHRGER